MSRCEHLCCAQVPVWLLKATRSFLRSFQWARDAADRLVPPLSSVALQAVYSWSVTSTSLSRSGPHTMETRDSIPWIPELQQCLLCALACIMLSGVVHTLHAWTAFALAQQEA